MIVLGLNRFHGDSAAALIHDGKLIAAAEEERFRRVKHWADWNKSWPISATRIICGRWRCAISTPPAPTPTATSERRRSGAAFDPARARCRA